MALGKSDGSVIIDTRVDTKGFGKGINTMQKQVSGLDGALKKLGAVIATTFAVTKLVQFGKEAIDLGSDLQEVQNVVDVTFESMSESVNEFAKGAAEAAGLSETMAKRYVGTFGAMAKAFGFAENESFNMSTALTQLAGDVASFYNISQDQAYTKLKSVFTGETETLKDLGVVMTQNALDSYAMAEGLGKTTAEMTEQEKVALRYQFVMKQLSAASGDFERTSGGWANQMRILSLNFDTFKANVGKALISVFTPLLNTINTLVSRLADFSQYFVAFAELIVGKTTANSNQSAQENLEGLEDGYSNVADATNEATKAQKQYLASIDELNTISTDAPESFKDSFSEIGAGDNAVLDELKSSAGIVEELQQKYPRLVAIFQTIVDKIREIGHSFSIGDFFAAGQSASEFAHYIFDLFTDAISNVDWEKIGSDIAEFIKGIDWETLLIDIGELIMTAIQSALKAWRGAFETAPIETAIITAIGALTYSGITKELFSPLSSKLESELTPVLSSAVSTAFESVLLTTITWYFGTEALEKISGLEGFSDAAQERGFLGVLEDIADWANGLPSYLGVEEREIHAFEEALDAIAEGVIYTDEQLAKMQEKWRFTAEDMESLRQAIFYANPELKELADHFTSLNDASPETLQDVAEGLQLIADGAVSAADAYKEFSKPMWGYNDSALLFFQDLQTGSENLRKSFAENSQAIQDNLSETDKQIIEWLDKIKTGAEDADKEVVSIFKKTQDNLFIAGQDAVDGFSEGLESKRGSLENTAASIAKSAIQAMYSTFQMHGVFGGSLVVPTLAMPKIPQLATGAVIPPNAPFMAMLGDQRNGTNIEAPADLIRQIVREETAGTREMTDLLRAIAESNQVIAEKDLTIGDRDVARANARGQRAMGYRLVTEG